MLATCVLTVPLLFIISSRSEDIGVRELERVAERVAPEVTPATLSRGGAIDLPATEEAIVVGVYRPDGDLVAGNGPKAGGELVTDAKRLTHIGRVGHELVVARPVVADESHKTIGVIRVAEPLSETVAHARRDQALLLLFDLIAVAIATSVGWYLATRLVRPIEQIRNDAVRLGRGDFAIAARTSGIHELDATSAAISDTAGRLEDTVRREREFTSNASHQLRTPLTALRLAIEGEILSPREDQALVLEESLREIERLESTITTFLDLARHRGTVRLPFDVDLWADAQRVRLEDRFGEAHRLLEFRLSGNGSPKISREVLDQIFEILIDNALSHGRGDILVSVVAGSEMLTVSVLDEGKLRRDPGELFVRNDPEARGLGIGLALGRALAEGEGGRLVVAAAQPTELRLTLPDSDLL